MPTFNSDSTNLDIETLRRQIGRFGPPDLERVYGYVVRTVRPRQGEFLQTGSAPNFNGGLITLCTCKHSMRASLTPAAWKKGAWIAGFTSWDKDFHKQQSLVYLMRVGEAFESHADLVQELRRSGRSATVDAKDSTQHTLGDVMIPVEASIQGDERFSPAAYRTPIPEHIHRANDEDDSWRDDINYVGIGGRHAAMLVGDVDFSFVWSRPFVRRRNPQPSRPYRQWSLSEFLDDLEGVPD